MWGVWGQISQQQTRNRGFGGRAPNAEVIGLTFCLNDVFKCLQKVCWFTLQSLCLRARAPTCSPVTPLWLWLFLQDLFMYLIFVLKKVALLFCPGEAQETSQIFQGLSRTYKQNSRTFQDSKKIPDFSRKWQPCWYYRWIRLIA